MINILFRKIIFPAILILTFYPLSAQLTIDSDSLSAQGISKSISLEEVVITGEEKNLNSRGLGNMQINMKQVWQSPLFFGERDVIKTLQFLPGVSAGMEGSSQLNIRGGTADQTLYLVDGVPIYNQNHAFGFFSMFNPDAIGAVNLYKGGIPTNYGDKLSGVVSVDLKDGDMKRYNSLISMGLLAWTLASDGPLIKDKLSYMVAARRSFPDLLYNGITALTKPNNKEIVMLVFYDINAKLLWRINNNNRLSWQIYTGYDELYGMDEIKESNSGSREMSRSGFGWRSTTTSLRYDTRLPRGNSLSAVVYYTHLNNFDRQKSEYSDEESREAFENVTSSQLNEFGGKVWVNRAINEKNKIIYGIETSMRDYMPSYTYKKVNGNTTEYDNGHLKLYTLSGYAHHELKYKGWLFGLGLRTSLFSNGDKNVVAFEPRVKASTFVGEKNKFMFAYDRMYQPVHTVNEMNYNFRSDFWIPFQENALANAHQISAGWKNYTSSNLSFSVEAYYKRMNKLLMIRNLENYIDFHTDYKIGKGNSMGVEFMAEYNRNRLTTWLSYTLSKSTRTFDGETYDFKYDAPHDISAFASYVVYKKGKKTNTLSTNVQYKTGYPYFVSEVSYPSTGLPGVPEAYKWLGDISYVDYFTQYPNIRLKDFFRVDINFTIEKTMKRGSSIVQFSLLNATARNNPYTIYKKGDKVKALTLIPFLPSIAFTRKF